MARRFLCCIPFCKDTNLKANHNCHNTRCFVWWAVFPFAKILIWKQITTDMVRVSDFSGCIPFCKDTNLKANHNVQPFLMSCTLAVFPFAKILIWKQITTESGSYLGEQGCIPFCKDTNLKANHNSTHDVNSRLVAVFPFAKILIWKQITTKHGKGVPVYGCIPFCKDTNLKANHNWRVDFVLSLCAVFPFAKILIWKQITTDDYASQVRRMLYSLLQRY